MRRHRCAAEFHLGCPYTSQPLCRCRLYERAPPLWKLAPPSAAAPDNSREAARQRLLGAIANGAAESYIDGALAYAVHQRATNVASLKARTAHLLAALVDAAETRRDEAKITERLAAAEAAENERAAEFRRLREEARRAAEPPPPPPPPPQPAPMEDVPTAEDVAKMEEIKEMERERARIRKRERDRERRRLKKLEREEERLRNRRRR